MPYFRETEVARESSPKINNADWRVKSHRRGRNKRMNLRVIARLKFDRALIIVIALPRWKIAWPSRKSFMSSTIICVITDVINQRLIPRNTYICCCRCCRGLLMCAEAFDIFENSPQKKVEIRRDFKEVARDPKFHIDPHLFRPLITDNIRLASPPPPPPPPFIHGGYGSVEEERVKYMRDKRRFRSAKLLCAV